MNGDVAAAEAAVSQRTARVLVAAPGHPKAAPGGEAAFRLFARLAARPDCTAWFLGCQDGRLDLKWRIAQPFSEHEFIYSGDATDAFLFANRDPLFPAELADLVRSLRPDMVHFHGFAGLGVEAIDIVRRAAPEAGIVVTLQDFQAICAHAGQMVTRPARLACAAAGKAACARCFPEREPAAFWLRATYLRRFLDQVDQFTAPTGLLRQRHIDWGLPGERISVVAEVGLDENEATARAPRPSDGMLRVGYFGELSPAHGLDVLAETARLLAGNRTVTIDAYGGPHGAAAGLLTRGSPVLRHAGDHDPGQTGERLRALDAVVVPAIGWAEDRALIEAALANGRPVICADAGEPADQVRDGIDGYHFPLGDAATLARLLERLAALPHRLRELAPGVRRPPTPDETVDHHLELYRRVGVAAR